MQLRLHQRQNRKQVINKLLIKTVLIVLFFFIAIFFIDKIDMRAPNELIKHKIGNDKLTTLK
jgi:hypothetical protein